MGFWKGVCAFCGAVACAAACIGTGGLATGPILAYSAVAGGAGFLVGDRIDKENDEREVRLMQNQKYKDAKGELDNQLNQITTIQGQIDTINGKINGTIPREPNETDEYLRNQLIILTDQLNNGRKRVTDLRAELDRLRKELGGVNSLLGFLGLNKLGFMDKVMIIGGIVVIIFLLKG